jgi:hypothetical protein
VRLVARLEGGVILLLAVDGVPVLTSTVNIGDPEQPAKPKAGTHTMCPPGPNDTGPDHGNCRGTVYVETNRGPDWLELTAFDPDRGLYHVKTFCLLKDGLRVVDRFINLGQKSGEATGEHLYFATTGVNALRGIRMMSALGSDLELAVRHENGSDEHGTLDTFVPALLEGKTVSMAFDGAVWLYFPRKGLVLLEALATHEGRQLPLRLWAWHRDGTDTACFEPVAGTKLSPSGEATNHHIPLGRAQVMELITVVRLISQEYP